MDVDGNNDILTGGNVEDRDARMVRDPDQDEVVIDRPHAPPVINKDRNASHSLATGQPSSSSMGLGISPSRGALSSFLPFQNMLPRRIVSTPGEDPVVREGLGLDATGQPLWKLGRPPKKMTNEEMASLLNDNEGFNVPLSNSLPLVRPFQAPIMFACERPQSDFFRVIQTCSAPESHARNASIILSIHNESLSLILRTIHTIFERTPRALLKEIILIDDGSTVPWIAPKEQFGDDWGYQYYDLENKITQKYHLVDYLGTLPGIIRLFRVGKQEGSIHAKALGLSKSSGDVAIFLDAHVEVGPHWLEPIMERLYDDTSAVLVPRVHHMIPESFELSQSIVEPPVGFFWKLLETPVQADEDLPVLRRMPEEAILNYPNAKHSNFAPIVTSPVMAGGMFAAHRDTLEDRFGGFDTGMPGKAGMDSLELSLRIWMTGGRIEYARCSNIQHLFRRKADKPSSNLSDTASATLQIILNKLRTMILWMDDWATIPYQILGRPIIPSIELLGSDIGQRLSWRRNHPIARTRNFQWFIKNIYPESSVQSPSGELLRYRRLQNRGSGDCLNQGQGRHQTGRTQVLLRPCIDEGQVTSDRNRQMSFVEKHPSDVTLFHLMHPLHPEYFVFDKRTSHLMPGSNDESILCSRDDCDVTQQRYRTATLLPATMRVLYGPAGQIQFVTDENKCLSAQKEASSPASPVLRPCDKSDPYQWWKATPHGPDEDWLRLSLDIEKLRQESESQHRLKSPPTSMMDYFEDQEEGLDDHEVDDQDMDDHEVDDQTDPVVQKEDGVGGSVEDVEVAHDEQTVQDIFEPKEEINDSGGSSNDGHVDEEDTPSPVQDSLPSRPPTLHRGAMLKQEYDHHRHRKELEQ